LRASRSRGGVEGLPGPDQGVERQNVQAHAFNLDGFAGRLDLGEVSQPFDGTEAIEAAEVGVEIEIAEQPCALGGQFQGLAPGRLAVDRMEVGEGPLQGQQSVGREHTADVDVLGHVRASMHDTRKAAHDDKLDPRLRDPPQQTQQIAHRRFAF
jgi:hypothetical protein